MTYLHPITAALVLAALGYVASLAVRSRREPDNAVTLLRWHARMAPWVYAFMLVAWVVGIVTTWQLRPELKLATSGHFKLGIAVVGLLSASALSSRWIHRPEIRTIHPWFGAAALLIAAAQIFFGLQIMP